MELWIRSQDKQKLVKVENLHLDNDKTSIWNNANDYYFVLGSYKTKERALEVLDEIQNILKPRIIYTQKEPVETISDGLYQIKQDVDMKIQELSTYVYEMPEE